jgi:hypothetical protein
VKKSTYRCFKPVWYNERGEVTASVVSYSEDGANDRADELEDQGFEIIDVVEHKPGVSADEVEGWFK